MAKVRLHLGHTEVNARFDQIILCKKIHTVVIDGKTYYKNDCKNDSKNIQNFYRFIIKNVDKITYIKHGNFVDDVFNNSIELYLENKLLHNCGGFAYYFKESQNIGYYYIDGVKLSEKDFLNHPKRKIWLRENKLKRILGEQTEVHTCQKEI